MMMKRKFLRAAFLALIPPLALGACREANAPAQAPPTVLYAPVRAESLDIARALPGRVADFRVAEVRPQVGGILRERLFTEGAQVAEGQVLYRIDPAPFLAARDEAAARLAQARSHRESARNYMERAVQLAKEGAMPRQERDNAVAAWREVEGQIRAAEEALRRAEIELGYTEIRAPIAGRATSSRLREGALLSADQAEPLTVIRAADPVYVDVAIPAVELAELARERSAGELSADPATRARLVLENGKPYARLADGGELAGEILFSESMADPGTGSVTIRTRFPNPDGALLPGMYVRALLPEGRRERVIAIPQRSVGRDVRNRPQVFVLAPSGDGLFTVAARPVTLAGEADGRFLVEAGLSPGELIVIEGLQKARPGAVVRGEAWQGGEKQ